MTQTTAVDTRYPLLDSWRGVAASLVVIHHISPVKYGHEAVMLFFVISGYCIASAAERSLGSGGGIVSYLKHRARRIYPPYFLALCFFIITRWVKYVLEGKNQLDRTVLEWVQNVSLTQWLTLVKSPQMWAHNNPTNFVVAYWSLGYEVQFYFVVALFMLLPGSRARSMAFVASMLAAIVWILEFREKSNGLFLDYWFHFAVGSLVYYRFRSAGERRTVMVIDLSLCAAGAYVLAHLMQLGQVADGRSLAARESIVVLAFCLALVLLREHSADFTKNLVGRSIGFIGTISYSLYLVHQFNLTLVSKVVGFVLPVQVNWLSYPAELFGHYCVAAVFWYFCERPFATAAGLRPLG